MHLKDILDELSRLGKNVFTTYDVAKLIGKPTPYTSLILSKSKYITRIERGKYYINGTDPYEIASSVIFPAYVSLLAGLKYYNLIDQNVILYSVIGLKRHKRVDLNGYGIEFIKVKRSLFFGYSKKAEAYIAEPEKLIVDYAYLNKDLSILNEAIKNAVDDKLIDAKKLETYVIKAGGNTLANKIGLLMELNGIDINGLKDHVYSNYIKVKLGIKGISKKWRVEYD